MVAAQACRPVQSGQSAAQAWHAYKTIRKENNMKTLVLTSMLAATAAVALDNGAFNALVKDCEHLATVQGKPGDAAAKCIESLASGSMTTR